MVAPNAASAVASNVAPTVLTAGTASGATATAGANAGSTSVVGSEITSPPTFASTVWKSNADDGRRDDLYYDEDDEASDRN
ncbi:MAG: hypothetical protein IJZ10_00045 [Thermoguttaceae bacterium]|nr:hypothetical protein [Thermoguttaceae bacterium]